MIVINFIGTKINKFQCNGVAKSFLNSVLDFVDNIKNNGRETTSGVKLIFRENSGKFIF
tara:strand:+ start:2935 stop:3111 length:177 start_codon:yes stop_codon:yes gene_type:complete